MKMSSNVGAAVVFGWLAISSASANVADSRTLGLIASGHSGAILAGNFVQGQDTVSGAPDRQAQVRAEMSQTEVGRYFDSDALITLGALAFAGSVIVAAGIAGVRRRATLQAVVELPEGWRDEAMQALEADLLQFTTESRRVA
jgi:hypothetical protein